MTEINFPEVPKDDLSLSTNTININNQNIDDDNDNDDDGEFVEEFDQPKPVLQPMVSESSVETLSQVLARCQLFSRFPQLDYLLQSLKDDEKLKERLANYSPSNADTNTATTDEIDYCLSNCRFMHGDITRLAIDVVVNSCHPNREQGDGLDYAIHQAAGDDLRLAMLNATIVRNGCAMTNEDAGALLMPSDCCVTNAFRLSAKKIIHICSPSFLLPDSRALLESSYNNILTVFANLNDCSAIALPCLSVGVHGFDAIVGCEVAMQCVFQWQANRMRSAAVPVKRVTFVVYDISGEVIFNRLLPFYLQK